MPDIHHKPPQEVAARLDVSPSTLRRWSDEFAEFLSQQASDPPGKSHRRYSEQDLSTLLAIKGLMNDGLTYEQVRQRLRQQPEFPPAEGTLVPADDLSLTTMAYLSETIDELHKGQLSVLNSQAANRELMGVLIQDNFNLKDENNRLRERMLDFERQMGTLRRDEAARREAMRQEVEHKLMEIREVATRSPITVLQSRSGCLGSLLGGGQIQAVPAQDSHSAQQPPPPPKPYPRPPGPPE
ncbi:MAG: MerR family transcriptional regulator [Anaerolineae bacterium]